MGTCPNIGVKRGVINNSPFFFRPYHVKEEDKQILDRIVRSLCNLGILNPDFSAYSSLFMLIHRRLIKDNWCVSDFRHINMRKAIMNLAFPLVKDTFSMLGSSKCLVLLVIDLKDAVHLLRLRRI